MTNLCTLDFETSTGETIHGPTFRDPANDIYTIIYGSSPNNIKLLHSKKGFKRRLPRRVGVKLLASDYLVTQNGKFDMAYIWNDKYFQKWLLKGGKLWDIAYVRYLLSYQRHQYPSMAEMEKLYLGIKKKIDRISYIFSKGIGADRIIAAKDRCKRIWKLYNDYGINDGRSPLLIMRKQYAEAKAKGMLKIIALFNAYLLSLTMIETNGIPVDIRQLEENERIISIEYLEYLEKAQNIAEAEELWGDPRLPPLNINSNDHKSLILFGGTINCTVKGENGYYKPKAIFEMRETKKGKLVKRKVGFEPAVQKFKNIEVPVEVKGFGLNKSWTNEQTKEGFYQTGADIIIKIYKNSKDEKAKEFCKYMALAATSSKMLNTYVRGIKDRTVNGKIYPNLNNTEVITTRLSSSKINMQNIPSEGKYNKLIQGLFVAPPGWTCVSIDFSQLEVYIQGMLANDWKLIKDLQDGVDFHVKRMCWMPEVQALGVGYQEGIRLAKIDKLPEWEARRKKAKPIGFKKAYGGTEEGLARDTGIPLEDMKEIFRKEAEEYPDIVIFDETVAKTVYANTQLSKRSDYAEKYTKGTKQGQDLRRRFLGDIELLPIKKGKGSSEYYHHREHLRHIGVYTSPTGKRYAFEERATKTKTGDIYKYFLSTQMKNYAVQGGASDVQACTTVEMFQFLLRNPDKVKMLNEIHDNKWFIVKNEYLSCIVPKLCDTMSKAGQILKRRFGIETDLVFANEAKVGANFSDMKPFKLEEYVK